MMAEPFDGVFADIDINKLPTLPQVLLVFLDATHTEVVSFDRLADLIQQDASLTARIVAAANSGYYAGQGRNLSFERVLVLLGIKTIKTIAITASVQQFFSRFDSAVLCRQKRFWRDSLTCAQLAKSLAQLTGYPYEDEAYLAGLIHNIGALVFSNNDPEHYTALTCAASTEAELIDLEARHFGGNRYEAGAWVVSSWALDPFLADAVLYQSESLEALSDAHQLTKILAVASRISQCYEGAEEQALQAAEQLFDLNQSLVSELIGKARAQVAEIAASMDIDLGELTAVETADAVSEADEARQVALAARVRDIALFNGVRRDIAAVNNPQSVKLAILKSLKILFPCHQGFFFRHDCEANCLRADPVDPHEAPLFELEISLHSSASLLARCFNERTVTHSFSAETVLSVADRQLTRLSGGQGIVCLPLIVDDFEFGVLVVGLAASAGEKVPQQLMLWQMFANEAAEGLQVQQQLLQAVQYKEIEDRDYYTARAREIVHEVNNPLSIVKNYVHILASRLESAAQVQGELRIIREELERAGNILLRLPGITEQQVSVSGMPLTDVNRMISDLLKVFRASLFTTAGIEAITDFDEAMAPVACDASALKQVFTNVLKNAAEALPESGRITIETQAQVNFNGRNYVEIVIADNGPGIAPEIQENLFAPVKTTKGKGHAGLGLSVVKNLVDEMQGFISCRSSARNGTRFEILIPRATEGS